MGKGFNTFIRNPYWANIYGNAPKNIKSYYELTWDNNEKYSEEVAKQLASKYASFIKADWEYLISVSHGHAKYEYTKAMNAFFPKEAEK